MHSVLTQQTIQNKMHINFVLLLFLSLAGTAVVLRQCLKAEDACSSNADPAVFLGSISFGSVGSLSVVAEPKQRLYKAYSTFSDRTASETVQGMQYILRLQLQRLYKACSTFSDYSFRHCTRHAVHSQAAASETGCTGTTTVAV